MYEVAQPYFSNQDISWIKKGVEKVLKGQLSTGPYVKEFEEKFATQVGCKYAVFVTNATAALEASCKILGLKEGDDVIVPGETFVATGTCVTLNGGNLVFAEVDPDTFCMTLDEIKRRVTKNTKGVIIVHFGGYVSPDTIKIRDYCKKNKLFLIEDASHAHGASINNNKIGSIGDTGCFSFFSTKILTTGEGGMLTTNSKDIYDYAIALRERGRKINSKIEIYDYEWRSCRVPEISALLGLSQLSHLSEFTEKRNKIASIYNGIIKKNKFLKALPQQNGIVCAYWKHITLIENKNIDRKDLSVLLKNDYEIKINWAYDPPMHLQPVYKKLYGLEEGALPVTEDIMSRHFHLPMHVSLSQKDARYIANSLCKAIDTLSFKK